MDGLQNLFWKMLVLAPCNHSIHKQKTITNMGQSLSQQYIHLVTGTKFRQPTIKQSLEPELHAYIAGILKSMKSPALAINSVPDHIHIFFRLSKNEALAKVVEQVKKQSSKWMKENGAKGFTWQRGYGAFSVSSSKVNVVVKYVKKQKEHHKIATFQEEIEDFVKHYNLDEYNPEFFWE